MFLLYKAYIINILKEEGEGEGGGGGEGGASARDLSSLS
jgi:hypothetical protein